MQFFFLYVYEGEAFLYSEEGVSLTCGHKRCQNLQSVNSGEYARNYHKENANVCEMTPYLCPIPSK